MQEAKVSYDKNANSWETMEGMDSIMNKDIQAVILKSAYALDEDKSVDFSVMSYKRVYDGWADKDGTATKLSKETMGTMHADTRDWLDKKEMAYEVKYHQDYGFGDFVVGANMRSIKSDNLGILAENPDFKSNDTLVSQNSQSLFAHLRYDVMEQSCLNHGVSLL